ncbi:MAG: hypothetical protein HY744_01770 [Deltaproteobacteria bacterium]|nr:hypothetical protein [Deltaproteobacteria bacterium]
MCVIIDANLAAKVFGRTTSAAFRPIFDWLEHDGRLVYGGRLSEELERVHAAARYLLELRRQSRAKTYPADQLEAEEAAVRERCRSDDPHVIALARLSGARTLVTADRELMDDFRNRQLVPSPRGRIYDRPEHEHLLVHTRGCPGPPGGHRRPRAPRR